MIFRKYHIVVFKDDVGVCSKMRIRGLSLMILILLFGALAGGNIYLYRYFQGYDNLTAEYQESIRTVESQKDQLLSLTHKLRDVEKDLVRIRDFDSKLRVMINLDQGQLETVSSVGGSDTKDFANGYLPAYRQEMLARKMHNFVHQLNTEVRLEEVRQQELMQTLRKNQDILASTPSIWPTEGWISSPFGRRKSPFTGRTEFHKGLDISGRRGTPIYAPAKGKVSFTGVDGGYGKSIVVNHGAGMVTRYAHLHRSLVKKNQEVERGELIGYMGNTGRSTGPHLHYEVRLNGVCVNPMRYILN